MFTYHCLCPAARRSCRRPRCPERMEMPRFSLTFYKKDSLTGQPLEGALYLLEGGGRQLTARSGRFGLLAFYGLAAGSYTLREMQPPKGHMPAADALSLNLQEDGSLLINGVPAAGDRLYSRPLPRLSFVKADALSGLPLFGARFWLSNGMQAVSDTGGRVDFGFLEPGSYTLGEISPPPGYIPEKRLYRVEALEDGRLQIDGADPACFTAWGHAYAQLSFQSVDMQSGRPLQGAIFRLSNGQQEESGPDGWLSFGILTPGIYGLVQVSPPPGYRPFARVCQVEIYSDGVITVDNQPLDRFMLRNLSL